jgi:hypothetical protein
MVAPFVVTPTAHGLAKLPTWGPQAIWATLALAGALFAGALAIAIFDRWRKRPGRDRLSAGDQLTQFRTLYEEGELSSEEFDQIQGLLKERMVQELNLAAPPDQPPADAPAQGEPPAQAQG